MSILHRASRPVCAFAVGAAAFLAGCGDDDDFANEPRPPSPVVITAAISPERVSVSPDELGAGPITLVVTNQSDATQRLTLRGSGGATNIEQQTGPINPSETASLQADLPQGDYEITATAGAIDPAALKVGPERKSAQDELLQP
ncbi:MAG TPA: hypothetical protein VD931_08130 [Baekduia sp.]|nr:hypothetical protein [Baekduia sp.]